MYSNVRWAATKKGKDVVWWKLKKQQNGSSGKQHKEARHEYVKSKKEGGEKV